MNTYENLTSFYSTNPRDYYYTFSLNGAKLFNSHKSKQSSSVSHLTASERNSILAAPRKVVPEASIEELEKKRAELVTQRTNIDTKISLIDISLSAKRAAKIAELFPAPYVQPPPLRERKHPLPHPRVPQPRPFFDQETVNKHLNGEASRKRARINNEAGDKLRFLASMQITTKSEWRTWCKKHHPDHGGENNDVLKMVLAYGGVFKE